MESHENRKIIQGKQSSSRWLLFLYTKGGIDVNLEKQAGSRPVSYTHLLYSEFKEFFPENAVEYFVSYYACEEKPQPVDGVLIC